jgi:hypothetical protein
LFVVARNYLREVKGIAYAATSLLWMGIAWLLLALNGHIANFLSLVIGTVCGLLSCIFNVHALAAFKQQHASMRWLYALVVFAFIGNYYFIEINFNMAAKIVVTSTSVAILQLASSLLLLSKRNGCRPPTHRLTGIFFAMAACIYAIRAIYYFVWDTQTDQLFFHVNVIQDLTYLTNPIAIVGTSFGFALMCIERYINEKNRAQELLHTAQQAAGMHNYVTDLRTGVSTNSPGLNTIYGVDAFFPHTVDGIKGILHPEDVERVMTCFQEAIVHQKKHFSVEFRTVSPINDKVHWIAAWGINFFDEEHNPMQQKRYSQS